MSLVNKKAAVLVKDVDAQNNLVQNVLTLFENEQQKQELATNIATLGKPDAANDIKKEVFKLISK